MVGVGSNGAARGGAAEGVVAGCDLTIPHDGRIDKGRGAVAQSSPVDGFDAHFTGVKSRRNRILLFVSLGEHYVEIIADHDTHARVPAEVWNKVLEDLVADVKAGRVANGLLAAIDSCGTLLKSHYQDLGDRPDRH